MSHAEDAASDPAVLAAAERVAEDRPYEDAVDIKELVAEYLRLWCNLT